MFYLKISEIFKRYEECARVYEQTFRSMLMSMEPSIDPQQLQDFPKNLHLYAKKLIENYDFSSGRETYIATGKLFGNNFLTHYMNLAVEDFKNNPQGSIDLLEDKYQDAFYGQIYEGFLAGINSKPEILNKILGLDNKGQIKLSGKGLGTEKHPGDIQMFLEGFDLDKAVDLASFIEVKYSDDYMQTISMTKKEMTQKFTTTDQIWEQIYDEIKTRLEKSMSADYSTGWMEGDIDSAQTLDFNLAISRGIKSGRDLTFERKSIENYAQISTPKALIFIMKNEGLWLSELLERMEPIVQNNAQFIIENKLRGMNKNRLWYSAH